MICFDVYRNGARLCRAGVGEHGVLHVSVDHVSRSPEHLAALIEKFGPDPRIQACRTELVVGGLRVDTDEFPRWAEEEDLVAGDEILVRVVAADDPDPPARVHVSTCGLPDPDAILAELSALEGELRQGAAGDDPDRLDALVAEDFAEIDAAGVRLDRAEALARGASRGRRTGSPSRCSDRGWRC